MKVNKSIGWRQVFPGIEIGVLAYDAECMPVLVRAKSNSVASPHRHQSKQYGFVINGSVTFRAANGEDRVKTGESYLIESNEEHSATFGPESGIQLLEIFVPARKELVS